ncbi:MAG: STAS domain-containing protein [Spirochaetia bacterium]
MKAGKIIENFNKDQTGINLSVSNEKIKDNVLHLRLSGYLDNQNSRTFQKTIENVLSNYPNIREVAFHMEGLSYVSSTGIGALVEILLRSQEQGFHYHFYNVPQKIKTVIEILGFTEYFNMIDTPVIQ